MNQSQTQTRPLARNHRYTTPRVYPEVVKGPTTAEREAAYQAALKLVARIDEDLTRGIRHYRNKAGVLLTTLDEVIRAILESDLARPEFIEGLVKGPPEEQPTEMMWIHAQELGI